jgi:hypothetical protein
LVGFDDHTNAIPAQDLFDLVWMANVDMSETKAQARIDRPIVWPAPLHGRWPRAWHHLTQARLAVPTSLILLILTWFLLAPAGAATQLPVDKPLHFGTDKIVEFSAELARHRAYYLDIAFPFRDAQQRAYMRNIVGDATRSCKLLNECGIPTAFLVTIKNGDNIVLKEERRVFGHYAFDVNKYYRNIIIVRLRPGTYTITVEPTENSNEIMDVDAVVELSTDARATDLKD